MGRVERVVALRDGVPENQHSAGRLQRFQGCAVVKLKAAQCANQQLREVDPHGLLPLAEVEPTRKFPGRVLRRADGARQEFPVYLHVDESELPGRPAAVADAQGERAAVGSECESDPCRRKGFDVEILGRGLVIECFLLFGKAVKAEAVLLFGHAIRTKRHRADLFCLQVHHASSCSDWLYYTPNAIVCQALSGQTCTLRVGFVYTVG